MSATKKRQLEEPTTTTAAATTTTTEVGGKRFDEELQLYKDCLKIFKHDIKESSKEMRVVSVLPRIDGTYKAMHEYVPMVAANDEVEQYKERFTVTISSKEIGVAGDDKIMMIIFTFKARPH